MKLLLAVAPALLVVGCGAPSWNEPTRSWGSMGEVMRDGLTQGRVSLRDVLDSEHLVGLGALEGLCGEIAIVGGVAWIARIEDGELRCARGTLPGDQATLLAVTEVRAWTPIRIERDLGPEALDSFLGEVAREHGFAAGSPWPFRIEGELADVEAHVLNGQCPFAGAVDPGREPLRRSFPGGRGRLIGFCAPGSAGTLVHRGETAHVHLIVEDPDVFVGHVDQAGVRAGALLFVPRG